MNDKIIELLTQLRLGGMINCIDNVLKVAEKNGLATEDVLLQLLETEHRDRQSRFLTNRIAHAKLPEPWTLDTFPFSRQPGVNKIQIMNMAKLNFIERHENIIFIGEPGRGKSGLAMGLLQQALLNGYRCRWFKAQELLDNLYASLADHRSSRQMKNIFNYDLICIDELGYLNLNDEKVNIFFKLIDMRYGKKPTIVTTNLPFNAWYDVFKQKGLVDALLDRFRHYCVTVTIKGPSLREGKHDNQKNVSKKQSAKKTK